LGKVFLVLDTIVTKFSPAVRGHLDGFRRETNTSEMSSFVFRRSRVLIRTRRPTTLTQVFSVVPLHLRVSPGMMPLDYQTSSSLNFCQNHDTLSAQNMKLYNLLIKPSIK